MTIKPVHVLYIYSIQLQSYYMVIQQLCLEEEYKSSFCWMNNAMNGVLYMYIMHIHYSTVAGASSLPFYILVYIFTTTINNMVIKHYYYSKDACLSSFHKQCHKQ